MSSREAKISQWSSRFERFQRSHTSVTEFCDQERVTVQAFYYWRSRVPKSVWQPRHPAKATTVGFGADHSSSHSNQIQIANGETPVVRFTLRSGETTIQCESNSLQSIELLLKWASSSTTAPSAVFQQLR